MVSEQYNSKTLRAESTISK